MNKHPGPGHGELPAKTVTALPWDEVAVNLIGPWTFAVGPNACKFHALTCIDPLTVFCEVIRINGAKSLHVTAKFDMEWLTQHPRPLHCIHDQGGEFIGPEFQAVSQLCGVKDVPTSAQNPQANAVNERLHLAVAWH